MSTFRKLFGLKEKARPIERTSADTEAILANENAPVYAEACKLLGNLMKERARLMEEMYRRGR